MLFLDPPAVVSSYAAPDQADVVEVIGTRRDQAQKIDRRIYTVRDTPHAAQQDSIDLLRGLPSVTVGANDQIMLLGSGAVTIQVDGQPTPYRNVAQFLHTLHGSDVERIEIITNPSAQYSAQGSGGIINFILRRKTTDGLTGTSTIAFRSSGSGDSSLTVKYKRSKWAYEVNVQAAGGRGAQSAVIDTRSVQTKSSASPDVYSQNSLTSSDSRMGAISFKVSRSIGERTVVSSQTYLGGADDRSTERSAFLGTTPDFLTTGARERTTSSYNYVGENLSFDQTGAKDGEELQASVRLGGTPSVRSRSDLAFDDGVPGFQTDDSTADFFTVAKVDWTHPTSKERILSVGVQWQTDFMRRSYTVADAGDGPISGLAAMDRYDAATGIFAGYATYQIAVQSWTLMPGIRVERYGRTVKSPSRASIHVSRVNLFPSLHVEHTLGKRVELTFSYSKRIARPAPSDLRPYAILQTVDTIRRGNPNLRDEVTDSFEAALHYHRGRLEAGLTIYDRETSGLRSDSYSVEDSGVVLITPINFGRRSDRGAELDLSTPLWRQLKVMASINVFDDRRPLDPLVGPGNIETFRYSTNTSLLWNGHGRGDRPGDTAQFLINYQSPSRDFQTRYSAFNKFTLSYTHSFSRSLSATATIESLLPLRIRAQTIAPLIRDLSIQRSEREVLLKLLKSFGKR